MAEIKFRIAAKTDVGCARTNNEDNFQAAADLTASSMTWVNNQTYDLGDKGALLVVADGMGGMNAGEIASEIAIETVREYFAPDRITPEVIKNRFSIEKYMKDVVVEADHRIKQRSTDATRGMGTTIVMAWLIGGQCYVCWCGDSRAYIYNPVGGLFQVSKDHSYVQSLVDAGEISEEDAFDYPNSNVITRCLCDAKQKAVPDCLLNPQPLCDGDIILLCSDGLSGMLRDNEMKDIIEANRSDMNVLTDALIDGALKAGGNDNVTVAVASIDSGGAESTPARVPAKVLPKPHQTTRPIASSTVKPMFNGSASAKTEDTQIAAGTASSDQCATKSVDDSDATTRPVKNGKTGKPGKQATNGKGNGSAKLWGIIGFLVIALLCAVAYIFFFNEEPKVKHDLDEDPIEKEENYEAEEDQPSDLDEEQAPAATTPAPAPQHQTRPVKPSVDPSEAQQRADSLKIQQTQPGTETQPAQPTTPATTLHRLNPPTTNPSAD